jgi:endonuclease/exonuclease/phosphatase family metal-dependent hydrolase
MHVDERLEAVLSGRLERATRGIIPAVNLPSIDHVAHSPDLLAASVQGLSNRSDEAGAPLSDHFGVVAELVRLDS